MKNIEKLAVFLCFIGICVAGYLAYSYFFGKSLICGFSDCGIVNASKYSSFIGIPVAVWGLFYYIGILAILYYKNKFLLLIASSAGFIFSLYLTFIEAFVIHAWCQWCVLSAWLATAIFIIAIKLWIEEGKPKSIWNSTE